MFSQKLTSKISSSTLYSKETQGILTKYLKLEFRKFTQTQTLSNPSSGSPANVCTPKRVISYVLSKILEVDFLFSVWVKKSSEVFTETNQHNPSLLTLHGKETQGFWQNMEDFHGDLQQLQTFDATCEFYASSNNYSQNNKDMESHTMSWRTICLLLGPGRVILRVGWPDSYVKRQMANSTLVKLLSKSIGSSIFKMCVWVICRVVQSSKSLSLGECSKFL